MPMDTLFFPILIGISYGIYDVLIKLGAPWINPFYGSLLTQTTSALLIASIVIVKFLTNREVIRTVTWQALLLSVSAGLVIGASLIMLFTLLQNKNLKTSSLLPTILMLRNITVIFLGVFILKDEVTFRKILGFVLGIVSIYCIF